METLDVTRIEPRLKHPTIFEKFDALKGGETLVIHNDHDPKPLYYQMIAERGQVFDWEYLEEGPEWWKVKITKLNIGEKPATIGELAAEDYRKVEVFRKFGLDFCCGGKKSLKEACSDKGIDEAQVEAALKKLEEEQQKPSQDFNSWDLGFLADYIVGTHHKYVKEAVPLLREFSQKVARVHGGSHPEVVDIAKHFEAVAQELEMHMHKEEMVLFPYIKELAAAEKAGTSIAPPPFGSVRNPVQMMEAEHDAAGDHLKAIEELSQHYTPPVDACNTYRATYGKLKEFEEDLLQHIHLENNILFPRAIQLEEQLLK